MNMILFQAAARFLIPLQMFLSIYLFLRGHNAPGGGFIGGLMAAFGGIIYHMAFRKKNPPRWILPFSPKTLIALGWSTALCSGLGAFFLGNPFMTGIWGGSIWLPIFGHIKLGTVVMFDLGVFFLVWGMVSQIGSLLVDEE